MCNMGKAISYCINDSVSLFRLWCKRKVLSENRELAKLSFTDLEHSFFRAGGSKVRNTVIGYIKLLERNSDERYAVSNTRRSAAEKGKYEGAFVFPVDHVLNRTAPLSCLDFNSLYPSIIMAYNYSPEKIIASDMIALHGTDSVLQRAVTVQ